MTITHADQTTVLSFAAIRRSRFPVNGQHSAEANFAAHTVLAALGLCAATLAAEAGLDLRPRCLLWPTAELTWEFLGKPGQIKPYTISSELALNFLKGAVVAAKKAKLPWREVSVKLRPSDQLVKLVVKSQQLAITAGGSE